MANKSNEKTIFHCLMQKTICGEGKIDVLIGVIGSPNDTSLFITYSGSSKKSSY